MARYIDADALIKEHIEKEKGRYGSCLVVGDNRFLQRFLNAPTADVVEVVRCKDCKFWGESLTEAERNQCDVCTDLVCTYWMSDGLTRDDFCSYGKRRTDDGA